MIPGVRRAAALTTAVLLLASACGSDDGTTVADTAPSTTAATTTTEASTTTAAPTTSAPRKPRRTTTTLPALPTPIAPPPPGAIEPEIKIGTIEIPKIEIVKDLYAGITMATLDRGPGYWPGTAMPGQMGNTVVAGHRTSKDRPFNRIHELVPGDEIVYTIEGERYVYEVTGTEIVTPDALWITDQTYDYTTTLFACHPPGSTAYRIVVRASLVDPPGPRT